VHIRYVPALETAFLARKHPVGSSWRLDETYVRVKGAWKYLYRAVDKAGATVDFLLTVKRDRKAALCFLRKATGRHGVLEKITIDKCGANTAAIISYNANHDVDVEIRHVRCLSNMVEQGHRAIKRMVKAMLGFKAFWSAVITIVDGVDGPSRHQCAIVRVVEPIEKESPTFRLTFPRFDDLAIARDLPRRDRSPVDLVLYQQCPDGPRHLIGESHHHQHTRIPS
jgi:hypothetical protein